MMLLLVGMLVLLSGNERPLFLASIKVSALRNRSCLLIIVPILGATLCSIRDGGPLTCGIVKGSSGLPKEVPKDFLIAGPGQACPDRRRQMITIR